MIERAHCFYDVLCNNLITYGTLFVCLFVTVPPELPKIIDHWGRQLNTTVGPHNEGDDVILTCRVIGGEFV